MKAAMLTLVLLLLTACATAPMDPAHAALLREQMAMSTFEVDCPAGCSVRYRDPRDQLVIPRQTNGNDVIIAGFQMITQVAPVAGTVGLGIVALDRIGSVGKAGFAALQGSGQVTNTTTNTTTTETDNSMVTRTDNSVDNSGNTGRINSNDDYTHVPTIVTQPEPVILIQPPPVQIPAPIVVVP